MSDVDLPAVPRDEDIDGFAGQFLATVAEHLLRPRVDELDVPASIEEEDGIRHTLEEVEGFPGILREIRRLRNGPERLHGKTPGDPGAVSPVSPGRPGCGQKESPAVRGVARRGHRSRDAPPIASGTELRIV